MNTLLRCTEAISRVASVVARLMLIVVAISLLLQVILRFGFSYSLPWPEEAARYLMIWIVMISASHLVQNNELVRVDFLDLLWPKRLLIWRNLAFRALMVAMFVLIAYYGWDQAEFSARRNTAALQISWFWPYLAIPVGAVLVVIQLIAVTVRELASGQPIEEHISQMQETAQ
ncbi:TRAP transporter small permease [Frigidibacter sp. MR17.14]|uniref:TRAP transporter small permease n=1 Tax=Frigidibacter sp. MR17.14 TaxID=3126509 RepID=UPI0030130FBF